MRNALIAILIGLIISLCIKNDVKTLNPERFSRAIRIEEYKIKFYANDLRVIHLDTINPFNDYFDGVGYVATTTPKHKIRVRTSFDIYGHINLDMIDTCYNIFKMFGIDSSEVPRKITIVKYTKAIILFRGNMAGLAGLSHDGKEFILSEMILSNQFMFEDALFRLFKTYAALKILDSKDKPELPQLPQIESPKDSIII